MKGSNRIVQLDFFRSVAVILVILYHLNVYTGAIPFYNTIILNGGIIGVAMFFVLSGYLMTSFYTQKVNTDDGSVTLKPVKSSSFYSARFFRIAPLFIITTVLFFFLREHISTYKTSGSVLDIGDLLSGIFFINNKLFVVNPVIWTLKVEVIFYVIFPLIGKAIQYLFSVKRVLLLAVVPVFIIALSVIFKINNWDSIFFYNLSGLAVGILIRILVLATEQKYRDVNISDIVIIAGTLVFFVVLYKILLTKPDEFYLRLYVSLLMGAIFFIFLNIKKGSFLIKIMGAKFFFYVALISYSLYLWHFNIYYNLVGPYIKNIHSLSPKMSNAIIPPLTIILTILVSILTYVFIEKKSLSLKNLLFNKK